MTAFASRIARLTPSVDIEPLLTRLGCVDPETLPAPLLVDRLLAGWRRRPLVQPPAATAAVEQLLHVLPTGGWRIGSATARALAMLFQQVGPRVVLEFGSGSSTVLFAALCAMAGGGRRVVSIDEKEEFAERTRRLLQDFRLADYATLVVAPVRRTRLASWSGWMYCPPADGLRAAIGGDPVEFVFVDGPANWLGRRGDCRYGTLLLAAQWISRQATFAADDALRSRDLRMVRRWRALPSVDVHGVLPIGRGIAVGTVRGSRAGR